MGKKLSECIDDYDMLIVGIGSEWNWIKRGLSADIRYSELLDYARKEGNKWLMPIIEFEYGFFNNDQEIDEAYRILRRIIGEKKYFLVSDIFLQDPLLNGFAPENCVFPCGNYRYLQTSDSSDGLIDAMGAAEFVAAVDQIHDIIEDCDGHLQEEIKFNRPFFNGKTLYLNQKRQEYSNIKYNESAYLPNWDKYMQYLAGTMGKSLLVLELGVSLDYPTVIRWPFEKVAYVNDKARLMRVNERLYQHTPEIESKTDSIPMNSVKFILQESEGL